MSNKQHIPVIMLIIWFFVITAIMLLYQEIDFGFFFALVLIGILIVVETVDPASVRLQYLRRIKYVVAVGIILFGYIIANKIMGFFAS